MTLETWLIYLILVLVATSTPGPAVLFIVTTSTLHGWKKATFSALGNIAGLLFLGILAISGLGAILKTSETLFVTVKYSGAAYLIYLGIKLLFSENANLGDLQNSLKPANISSKRIFFQAIGVAVSNPKAIVFLTALFPQFININERLLPQFSILIATLMLFSFSFLILYALLAHKVKEWFIKPQRLKNFSRASGITFIGFGVLLAASSNK